MITREVARAGGLIGNLLYRHSDCGAGVVGIATAARLATSGRRLFVLERR